MRVLADKKLLHTAFGKTEEVQLWVREYPNGRTGLQLMCKMEDMDDMSPGEEHLEPYMTASVNLHLEPCPPTEVWVKDWSENEGITEYLVKWGVIEPERTAMAVSGYVVVDRHRFTPAMLLEIARVKEAGLKKQRGKVDFISIVFMFILGISAGYALDYLDRITKRIELATCTTDSECVNACRALLKRDEKDDCDDFMEERE